MNNPIWANSMGRWQSTPLWIKPESKDTESLGGADVQLKIVPNHPGVLGT
ncbi:MAG TPA: hypothetical protein VHD63_19210 [Ktedonobacteraceae bacterium]|jgi:hypothetical protein|nr:hypothetical protein [Ktedonobacteraceae bacterium]